MEVFQHSARAMEGLKSFRSRMDIETETSGVNVRIAMNMEQARDGRLRSLMVINSPEGKQEFETIMSEPDVYAREPQHGWVRINIEEQPDLGQAFQTANLGFFDIFPAEEVPWDLYTVDSLGREHVDGVWTEHLSVQADFQELWNLFGEEGKRNLTQVLAGPAGGRGDPDQLLDEVKVKGIDIWIDDQGYARRMIMEMELGELGTIKIDMRAFDFNEDIRVELPQDFEEFPAFLAAPAPCAPRPDLVSYTPSGASPPLLPSEQSNPDEMLRRAIESSHSLSSYLIDMTLPGMGQFEASGHGAKSGERAYFRFGADESDSPIGFVSETVIVPPYWYTVDPHDCKWYRSHLEEAPPLGDVQILEFFRFMFPDPDVPASLYEITPLGVEDIDAVQTVHFGVKVDWHAMVAWLETTQKLPEVATQLSPGESLEEFKGSYLDGPPDSLEIWIDGDGFVRQMVFGDTEGNINVTIRLKAPNESISIQPPMDFEEGPPPSFSFVEPNRAELLQALPAKERECMEQIVGPEKLEDVLASHDPAIETLQESLRACLSEETMRRITQRERDIETEQEACAAEAIGEQAVRELFSEQRQPTSEEIDSLAGCGIRWPGSDFPDFDTLPEATAPAELGTVAWPNDVQDSWELLGRLPSEMAGHEIEERFQPMGPDRFAITYGENPQTHEPELTAQVYDLAKGDFFLPDTTAGQFVAFYAQGADWEVLAAGREGDLAWVQFKTTGNTGRVTRDFYGMFWGEAASPVVFGALANDLGELMALVEAMVIAAGG